MIIGEECGFKTTHKHCFILYCLDCKWRNWSCLSAGDDEDPLCPVCLSRNIEAVSADWVTTVRFARDGISWKNVGTDAWQHLSHIVHWVALYAEQELTFICTASAGSLQMKWSNQKGQVMLCLDLYFDDNKVSLQKGTAWDLRAYGKKSVRREYREQLTEVDVMSALSIFAA